MAEKQQYTSLDEFIIHPGETILEIIKDRSITQSELAIRTGFSGKHISEVINGKKDISADLAMKLEYALSIPASFFRNLQANYDLEVVQFNELHNISAAEKEIAKEVKNAVETITGKTIHTSNGLDVYKIRQILNVSNLKTIKTLNKACYRAQFSKNTSENVMYTWQYLCEKKVSSQSNNELNIKKLKESLDALKSVMHEKKEEHLKLITKILNDAGILFTVMPNVKKAPISGLTVETKKKQIMIVLTLRYKYVDSFWFTLFHEIAHVINEDYKKDQNLWEKDDVEAKADKFASNILIDQDLYEEFILENDFSDTAIKNFAKLNNVLPTIILGRLMKDKYMCWSDNTLREQYSLEELDYMTSSTF